MGASTVDRSGALAAAGIHPGATGYALEVLEAFARARGWAHTSTPSTTPHGRPGRWRASVFVPACAEGAPGAVSRGTRASGTSEADALAKALATTLAREA